MKKPLCMTDDEMESWEFWNQRVLSPSGMARTPCADCTMAFQREMLSQDRCDQVVVLPPVSLSKSDSRRAFRAKERRALRLVNDGMSQVKAARAVGVAQTTVSKWVTRARGESRDEDT